MLTSQAEIRKAFWETFPDLEREARQRRTLSKGQNAQTTDCRCTFVDWLDVLQRAGDISERLADRTTL